MTYSMLEQQAFFRSRAAIRKAEAEGDRQTAEDHLEFIAAMALHATSPVLRARCDLAVRRRQGFHTRFAETLVKNR